LIENKHPLEEFKSFATSFQRILWLDGWWMNYIRSVANNITIYTLADCNVRSAFVGNESYKIKELSNGWFTGTATIAIGPQKLRNIYVAKESFGFFEDIDIAQVYNAIFCENTYTIL